MLEAFRLGGWGMFPTLFFGLLLLACSVRYAVKPERRWIPIQIALALVTFSSGMLGFVTGLIATTTYLGGVDTADVARIGAIGFGESLHNVGLALIALTLGSLTAAIGTARELRAASA